MSRARVRSILVGLTAATAVGCSSLGGGRGEGLDASRLPADIRPDYAVFAQRCSKCHSLARPLNSGIDDDLWWAHYVARMRAMPASGISEEDSVTILRFLHYYSLEQRRAKESSGLPTERSTGAGARAWRGW